MTESFTLSEARQRSASRRISAISRISYELTLRELDKRAKGSLASRSAASDLLLDYIEVLSCSAPRQAIDMFRLPQFGEQRLRLQ
jgi:hypothetical protein